jgi:hypothetical protein
MAKLEKRFHCDGYYFHKVCPSRGLEDPADIRYDQDGFTRQCRCFCKTRGLTPFDNYDYCPHCVEHKHLFRAESRVLTGEVKEVTPFKAVTSDFKVEKAYKTRKSIFEYAKDKPDLTIIRNDTEIRILRQGV